MEQSIKINLGDKNPCNLLPGDIIQDLSGNRYTVKEVGMDPEGKSFWIQVVGEPLEGKGDFILVEGSGYVPWYPEVCMTCATPESCDICREMTGWTDKKFAYIGDTIDFFGSKERVLSLSLNPYFPGKLEVTTDRTQGLIVDDPELKVIDRGFLCYRPKVGPDYTAHCGVCLRPKCSECFLQDLRRSLDE